MKKVKKITIIITLFFTVGLAFDCFNIDRAYAGAEILSDVVASGDEEVSANPVNPSNIANPANQGDTADPDDGATSGGTEASGDIENSSVYDDIPEGDDRAKGHAFSTEKHSRSYEPTCEKEGKYYYQCRAYGHNNIFLVKTIPALGHDYQISSVVEPTCGKEGTTTYTCTRCGKSYTETILTFGQGHDYVLKKQTKATCTSKGSKTYVCSTCGKSYTKTIAALGHNYVQVNSVLPTCEEDGTITYRCDRCGASYIEVVAMTGHSYDEIGEGTYKCSLCGDAYTEIVQKLVSPNTPVPPSNSPFNALSNVLISLMIAINAIGLAYLASFWSVFRWVKAKKAIAYDNIFGVE